MVFNKEPWYMRIKLLRTSLNMTQEQIATRIGITTRTYQRWELGESQPLATHKKLIADALESSPDDIFGGEQ